MTMVTNVSRKTSFCLCLCDSTWPFSSSQSSIGNGVFVLQMQWIRQSNPFSLENGLALDNFFPIMTAKGCKTKMAMNTKKYASIENHVYNVIGGGIGLFLSIV